MPRGSDICVRDFDLRELNCEIDGVCHGQPAVSMLMTVLLKKVCYGLSRLSSRPWLTGLARNFGSHF